MTTFDIAQEALGEFLCVDLENNKNGTIEFNVGQNPLDAQAVRAILNSITKNLLGLKVEWDEPVVASTKKGSSVALKYSLRGEVSEQAIQKIKESDVDNLVRTIREDLAFKIASPILDRKDFRAYYRIADVNFTKITKEDFSAIIQAWGGKYQLEGLKAQSSEGCAMVTLGLENAKTLHEQEQLGHQLNRITLTQGFKRQTGVGQGIYF